MFKIGIVLAITLYLNSLASCNAQGLESFKTDEIVPDVIDEVPQEVLEVVYDNGETVNFGNELKPSEVKDRPNVNWTFEEGAYYTLAMVDPDAPSRKEPLLREVKHWLVANINGTNLGDSHVIASYMGPGPPIGTGFHRYVLLVYKQQGKMSFDEEPFSGPWSRMHRLRFNIREFAKKHNLGQPLAGNFFKAQWEPYVELRNKKIEN